MLKSKRICRRKLLKGAAAASVAAPYLVSSSALGLAGTTAPSDRVTLGCIGVGGKGTGGMRNHMRWGDLQVVAVCDPNQGRRNGVKALVEKHYAAQKRSGAYKGCTGYVDFRELIARDDVDAVLVATQDHWHVPISVAAMRAGKDVYCEKPLGATVAEGSQIIETARTTGAVFQHGTQLRSLRNVRFACELVRNGRIGKLQKIHIGSPNGRAGGNHPPAPVPKTLDYDLWLGPAQWAPYTPKRIHAFGWYFISDYSPSGWVAGYAVHDMDIAMWGFGADEAGLGGPVQIEGRANYPRDGLHDTAVDYHVQFTFANGVQLVIDTLKPLKAEYGKHAHGVRFIGSEGWVYTRSGVAANPKGLLASKIAPGEIHLYQSIQHERNFIDCIKSRRPTLTPPAVAQRANSLCLLADIAMRLERKVTWDPAAERFDNDDEANRRLSRAMRSPWHL